MLTFVSTVAFAIQLLIFAYLYSSHRVRFFQYLLLAWGAYTLSKGLKLVDVLVLGVDQPSFATEVATVAAVGFTLAAAFAHRWDYRLRARDVLVGGGARGGAGPRGRRGAADEGQRVVGDRPRRSCRSRPACCSGRRAAAAPAFAASGCWPGS